jgi:hypothetical protein
MGDDAYLAADAEDRRAALHEASALAAARGDIGLVTGEQTWIALAEAAYRFLRTRDSLRATRVSIVPGTPYPEGSTPVTTTFDLNDTDQVEFTLAGADAKGAAVPLDSGFTAAWTLADPDATGATLTVSADTTNATVAAGVPDTNLMLSVVVTNPDGSTLNGAEAIVVLATAATTVSLVAGTPTAE